MPYYDYKCPTCGEEHERHHSIADCDLPQTCAVDGALLVRLVAAGTAPATDRKFQMRAIASDGRRIEGHFGTARRGKYTPGF